MGRQDFLSLSACKIRSREILDRTEPNSILFCTKIGRSARWPNPISQWPTTRYPYWARQRSQT